ncbi:MAG: cyclic nucleotide-binding/CBS domain-containing protein [Deltaproteobacteria bacterium]|jgi:CBS domain-containing protein|nr:cyclic nucleotide-binding/CBS domain-containing protein [Deltaproteobacteria bacterium]
MSREKDMESQQQKEPGPEIPNQRMIEFLRSVPPFDTLGTGELTRLISQMEMSYFPAGQRIKRKGDRPFQHLYIIQKGSARISLIDDEGEDLLVDIRGEGDYFGATSILQAKPAMFDISAHQDLMCLMLPAEDVRQLVNSYPVFERYFSFSLARTIKAVRQTAEFQCPYPIGQSAISLEVFLTGKKVADIMNKDILTCAPYMSVQAAAQMMARRQVSSIVVTGNGLYPLGIMTDNDLRTKVLAAGLSPEVAVAGIMSQPVQTSSPDADAFEALLAMSRHGVRLLVVVEGDHMVGIISERDLQMEAGSSPLQVIGEIKRTTSLDTLTGMRHKIDSVLEMMLRQGGPVKQLVALVTELNDRLTIRTLQLVEREMEHDGFGPPPVPYGWLAFGSEGRREQTLHTDQDNALFFAPKPECEEASCSQWFMQFARRVVAYLVRSGIPECPGGIMASNPQWNQSEDRWLDTFLGWIKDPSPQPLLMASIFFDFRPIYSGTNFPYLLEDQLLKAIRKSGLFMRFLAKNALINRPPLGLLKRFVVEKSGEHKNKFDLKQRGLTPVVDAARVLSLSLGIKTQNTLDRLAEINRIGIIDDDFHADLREAYEFLIYLQISRHLDALAQGEEPDNFLDPASLNGLQRKMMKESFAIVRRLQETIEFRFQTRLVEI